VSKQTISKHNITEWLDKVIAQPRKELGGMPICPFIRKYMNNITIVESTSPMVIAKNFANLGHVLGVEAIIVYGPKYSYDKLYNICDKINTAYEQQDVTCLAMHPDSIEPPLPLEYNFKWPILILQKTSTLEHAQNMLKNTHYYSYFKKSAK